MKKIFNLVIISVFVIVAALFAYKYLNKPSIVSIPVNENTVQVNNNYSKEQIEEIIRQYIANNPDQIVKSLESLQKKRAVESAEKSADYLKENRKNIEESGMPPILGNKDGKIKVVMFYDYRCSFCRKAAKHNKELIRNNPEVKLILRPMPILGEASVYAAKIALAVHKISEEKLPVIHDSLMKIHPINKESVKELLESNDIDYSVVQNEINSYSTQKLIAENFEFAKNLGIKGAPSYIIDGNLVPGMIDLEKFNHIVSTIHDKSAGQKDTNEAK